MAFCALVQAAKKASGITDPNDFSYIDTAVANFWEEHQEWSLSSLVEVIVVLFCFWGVVTFKHLGPWIF